MSDAVLDRCRHRLQLARCLLSHTVYCTWFCNGQTDTDGTKTIFVGLSAPYSPTFNDLDHLVVREHCQIL